MQRKIYDIIPPEQQVETQEEMVQECLEREPVKRSKRKFPFIPLLVLIVLALGVVVMGLSSW